jgi:Fe-S-cluster-containing dehydrogenase component
MDLDRRSLLKGVASAGAAAVASGLGAAEAVAAERRQAPADAVGMLYDATRCIGCKTCVVACHEANFPNPFEEETERGDMYFDPVDLDDRCRNIIKLFKDGERRSYVKRQCMHCIDPACAGACMIGALQKREHGAVTYDPSRCIGCRYCEVACPFNIPRFEWTKPFSSKIVKCELCSHRLAEGKIPACCEVCPTSAVIFGRYPDLLEEAHRRIADNPGRYRDHVYGEHEAGGTQVLYLGPPHVEFAELGLPALSDDSVAAKTRTLQHGIYQGFLTPVALYGILGAVMWRNRRAAKQDDATSQEDMP